MPQFVHSRQRIILLVLLLSSAVLLLVSACGPAGNQSEDDGWTDVSESEAPASSGSEDIVDGEGAAPIVEEAQETTSTQPGLEVDPGTQETDAKGLTVGFTTDGFAFRGDPQAPVVMETYSDYQCPFCGRFAAQTLPSLEQNQIDSGDVVLVFYDFPLPSHPQAPAAHQAAYCAGEEGAAAYWAMHDTLFAQLDTWANQQNTTELFTGFANEIDIDAEAFRGCLESGRYVDHVESSVASGAQRGVNSTPSFFINGQMMTGAQPLEAFNQAIDTVMSGGQVAGAEQPAPTRVPGVEPTPVSFRDDVAATMGDPDAAVTIIEFTDYQCPYCARHATQTLPGLIEEYIESGDVYYVVKDFPLDNIHPLARGAAAAARCAGDQDAYWEMHDELFARQQEWANAGAQSQEIYGSIAADLGLDRSSFEQCLDSGLYDGAVQANFSEGRELGVSATPTFFINGYPVPGAQPAEVFDFAIGLAQEDRLGEAYVQQEEPEPEPQPDPNEAVDISLGDAPRIGDPDAPVVIVEYTDFQCPYCSRHFQQTYPQIVENYVDTGEVLYVFKDFPLTSIHPQAVLAAEAARCARDQGAYIEMHDMLFNRQSEWNNRGDAASIFNSYASDLGLDTETFAACLESRQHRDGVMAELDEGVQLGVRGTPGFFINGHFLSGAQPYSVFEQAIEQLAAEAE